MLLFLFLVISARADAESRPDAAPVAAPVASPEATPEAEPLADAEADPSYRYGYYRPRPSHRQPSYYRPSYHQPTPKYPDYDIIYYPEKKSVRRSYSTHQEPSYPPHLPPSYHAKPKYGKPSYPPYHGPECELKSLLPLYTSYPPQYPQPSYEPPLYVQEPAYPAKPVNKYGHASTKLQIVALPEQLFKYDRY